MENKIDLDKIVSLMWAGYTNSQIAKKIGKSHSSVCNALKRAGLRNENGKANSCKAYRDKSILKPAEVNWAYKMLENGRRLSEVAKALSVDSRTVLRSFKRNGWERPRPEELKYEGKAKLST